MKQAASRAGADSQGTIEGKNTKAEASEKRGEKRLTKQIIGV
jgi:hypothetical protein